MVLTDLTMPGMTGVDLAKQLLHARPDVRIVVMSGYSATWDAESLKRLGILDLLSKPISIKALASTLSRILEGNRSR